MKTHDTCYMFVKGVIIGETDKAIHFESDELVAWLPKSQIQIMGDTIRIQRWLISNFTMRL